MKDSLNVSRKDVYRRIQRRKDASVKPLLPAKVESVPAFDDHRGLWREWKRARTDDDLEHLATKARDAGLGELEARCLERLAARRARGDWLADNRRPLPGGAYSNLRKA